MQGISGRIKADIEGGLAVVDQVSDLGGIRKLCQKASGLQFLVDFHVLFHVSHLFLFWFFFCLFGCHNKSPFIYLMLYFTSVHIQKYYT